MAILKPKTNVKKGSGRSSKSDPGRPMPGVVEGPSAPEWPGPGSNNNQFVSGYADTINERQFHVDYLLNTFSDFARPNMYKIEFEYNLGFSRDFDFLSEENKKRTEMTAKAVSIPAFDIGKQEIKRCGERLFIPTTQNFGDLQMTMMCDDNYTQRKFLHAWMKRIVYDTDYNIYQKVKMSQTSTIIIKQFDNKFNVVFAAVFRGAWPHSIGEIQLSFDSDSQIVEFPVNFCFSTYSILSNTQD